MTTMPRTSTRTAEAAMGRIGTLVDTDVGDEEVTESRQKIVPNEHMHPLLLPFIINDRHEAKSIIVSLLLLDGIPLGSVTSATSPSR